MVNTIDTEANLVSLSARGNKQAFGKLYDLYLEQIYRYIYYRVSDYHEAEDLTQAAFIKAWEKLPQGVNKAKINNFRAWIYKIAHNLVIDFYRGRKSLASLDEVAVRRDRDNDPEVVTTEHETTRCLLQAISHLDDKLKQVVILRFINQLDHAETAQIMGLKEGNVRVLQHRALVEIRKYYGEG
jgi:RNA polymerase sigma-70 factor (ECF subfamily)